MARIRLIVIETEGDAETIAAALRTVEGIMGVELAGPERITTTTKNAAADGRVTTPTPTTRRGLRQDRRAALGAGAGAKTP